MSDRPARLARFAAVLAVAGCAALAHAGDFRLSSSDVAEQAPIADAHVFQGFGCSGDNRSPALQWSDPPAGTQSYALTMYDPDAPTGSGWWHWVVVNIPASARGLPAGAGNPGGALPAGAVQVNTDFGTSGYGGPCPPVGHGKHRYIFTVHALKVPRLELPPNATAALAGFMINANRLGSATLTAVYER